MNTDLCTLDAAVLTHLQSWVGVVSVQCGGQCPHRGSRDAVAQGLSLADPALQVGQRGGVEGAKVGVHGRNSVQIQKSLSLPTHPRT